MAGILTQLTPKQRQTVEMELRREVGQRAMDSKSIEVNSPQGLVVRDILPAIDLDSGAENGWTDATGTTLNEWTQDWNSSGTADAWNEAYVIDSNSNAESKVVGFVALNEQSPSPEAAQVRFNSGSSGNQGVRDIAQLESLHSDDESTGYLTDAVIYGADQGGTIDVWLKDSASDGQALVIAGAVAEPVEENLTQPSNPLLDGANSNTRRR